MTEQELIKSLQARIAELEKKLKLVESQLNAYVQMDEALDAFFNKAKPEDS